MEMSEFGIAYCKAKQRECSAGAQKAQLAMIFRGRGFFIGKIEGVDCRGITVL